VIQVFTLEVIDRFCFVAQSDVNQRDKIASDELPFGPFAKLLNDFRRFVFLTGVRVRAPEQCQNLRIVVERPCFLVFGNCRGCVAFQVKRLPEIPKRVTEFAIQSERPL
jgi:hypothetical protein